MRCIHEIITGFFNLKIKTPAHPELVEGFMGMLITKRQIEVLFNI